MRWASTISREAAFERAVRDASTQALEVLGTRPDLAVVFASSSYGDELRELSELLPAPLRECTLVGCAAAGVIGGGEECEDAPALSLTVASLPGGGFAVPGGLPNCNSSTSCEAVWVARCGSRNTSAPADWIIPLTRWKRSLITAPARP